LSGNEEKGNPGSLRVDKMELALFGKDGRGGVVSDISEIKSDIKVIKSWSSFTKPLFVAIVTASIIYILTRIPWYGW